MYTEGVWGRDQEGSETHSYKESETHINENAYWMDERTHIHYLWFRLAATTDQGERPACQLGTHLGGEVVAASVDRLFLGSRNSSGGCCRGIGGWISDRELSQSFIIWIRDKEIIQEISEENLLSTYWTMHSRIYISSTSTWKLVRDSPVAQECGWQAIAGGVGGQIFF